ncbi:MAG: outer membrane protein transport protein [Deltaproteobacteria bacterium]|nr:outer membrane protein transport protein [Deltaproteobacteria bacterium]
MRKLALVLLLLSPLPAHASTFDTFGFGSRALSMGGAMTSDARDFTATFYNPSLIVDHSLINLGFGIFYESPSTTVTPDDPAAKLALPDGPPSSASYTLGFIFPFAGKLQDRLALGVGLSLPTRNLIKVQAVEPSEPSWYLYQSSPDRIQVFLGLGGKPTDWLYLGLGLQALSDFSGDIEFNVDLFNKNFQRRDLVNELITKQGLVAGLTLIPLSNLRIGFCWRQSMDLNYELPTNIALGDVGSLFLDVKGVVFFTPNEFTLGVHYAPIPSVTLDADLEYARWSAAPNPAAAIQVKFSGVLASGLGLTDALAMSSQDAPPGFEDILIPRFGVEWRVVDSVDLRGGYYFRPTMVPLQNGLTNILDGPTHVLSGGIGFRFMSPMETMTEPVEIDAVFQYGIIGQRHADKTETNPDPPYSYSGQTEVFAIDLRYNFDIVRPTPSKPKSDAIGDDDKPKKDDASEEQPQKLKDDSDAPAPKKKPDPAPKKKQKPKTDDDDGASS